MKLLTKAILFVLFIILLFIITFKFILFQRVVYSLISTGDEINFKLHKIPINIVNNILYSLPKIDKIKLLNTTENLFPHHKHFIIDKNEKILPDIRRYLINRK